MICGSGGIHPGFNERLLPSAMAAGGAALLAGVFSLMLCGRGPRGAPDAIGVVSPVEVLVADEVRRRGTLDSGG